MKTTIGIIGVGSVGASIAHSLSLLNLPISLLLLDLDTDRCAAEVQDLSDVIGAPTIRVCDYAAMRTADIVIIAAGRRQKPHESRLELVNANTKMLKTISQQLQGLSSHAKVIMVTNPLDILTSCAHEWLNIDPSQVFGTGTYLDTQRMRHVLAQHLDLSPTMVYPWVLGEHGDSQVVVWSATHIAGQPVSFWGISEQQQDAFALQVQRAAYDIIASKGATYYGIASCVAQLCRVLIYDAPVVLPLSTYHKDYGVCLSQPVLLTGNGIKKVYTFCYTDKERAALEYSAKQIKATQCAMEDGA